MNTKTHVYTAKINIVTIDQMGVLADLVSVFTKAGLNIEQINTKILIVLLLGLKWK